MTKNLTKLIHLFEASLPSSGEIALLGATADSTILAETFDADAEEALRWHIRADGQLTERIAEADSRFAELPPDLVPPQHVPPGHPWNFSGARWRGMREADRVSALVQPLTIMEKMPLIVRMGQALTPMQLLGIAENRLLARATFPAGDGVLCRMIRLAYALTSVQQDADGLPYDYDTATLYLIHGYDPAADELPSIGECLGDFAGVAVLRPMDCLFHQGRLIVADGGAAGGRCRVLVFGLDATS